MAQVTQKVVEIKAKVEGEKTVKMLKDQIAELTHLMDTLDTESLEYHRTVDMLVDAQEELNTVMKAGKSQLSAQDGSYNALVNRMAALKKAQKAVTDEASRMRLGDEIRKINDQLKEIDANNGVYVRNVGNYENAVKKALKTPQQELRALRVQLAQLQQGTTEYNAVFARMAQLTHDVTEQQEMLKWSSADLGDILGNLAGVATSVAGGFSAFNALGGLLGMGENEDMEKAMLQAQRFLQLIQGLEQLEQLGDKIKGLWEGLKNFTTNSTSAAIALTDFSNETEMAENAMIGASQATSTNAAITGQAADATNKLVEAERQLTQEETSAIERNTHFNEKRKTKLALLEAEIAKLKEMIALEIEQGHISDESLQQLQLQLSAREDSAKNLKMMIQMTDEATEGIKDGTVKVQKLKIATEGETAATQANTAATNTGAEATRNMASAQRELNEVENSYVALCNKRIVELENTIPLRAEEIRQLKELIALKETDDSVSVESLDSLKETLKQKEEFQKVQERSLIEQKEEIKAIRDGNATVEKSIVNGEEHYKVIKNTTAATVANTAATELNHKGLKGKLATMILNSKQNKLSVAEINAMTTAQLANTAATIAGAAALGVLKTALISTGIGAILVALGALLNLLGKGLSALWGWISGANKAQEQTEALNVAMDALNESLAAQEKAWERQEMLMDAQGKSYEEIYEARRKNLQAQLAEASALLASQKAIAEDIGQRKLQKKKYDEFRETLEELTQREKELKETLDDLDYDNYIQGIKDKKKAEEEAAAAAKKAAEEAKSNYNKQKEEADKLYKSLIEHYKTEQQKLKEKYDKEKAMLEKYGKDTTLLTKKYEEEKTAIVLNEIEARRKEEERRLNNEKSLLQNPSLAYFELEIEAAEKRYNELVDINNMIAKREISLQDGLAKASSATEMEIKNVDDLKTAFGLLMKNIEDARAALYNYKDTIKETTSDELVTEIEAQIAAIEALIQMKQRKIEQEYHLYESSNNYYTDFENNYISQMYKRWEAEDAIHQMRIANLQEMADKYKEASENVMLTDEARVEAARKAEEIEAQITQENTDHIINSNYRKMEAADNYVTAVQDSLSGISQILGDVASAWETSIQAQVDAGEISEEEGEKQMENMRGIQSAIALINALSSAVSAYNSMASIPYVGPALGAAAAAAALASGIAQVVAINKVKRGDKDGGDNTRYAEATPTMPEYNPTSVTNVTGGQETENLANAMTKAPIYVTVKDIDTAQNRVRVREKESTF